MILYLDTSSLAKLYIEEPYSDRVAEWVEEAEVVATCRVAYPEMLSALSRRFKDGDISANDFRLLARTFFKEWASFLVVDFDEVEAGRLAKKYGLKGLDAIHLSSFKLLSKVSSHIQLAFSSFDKRLNQSVAKEGYMVLTP